MLFAEILGALAFVPPIAGVVNRVLLGAVVLGAAVTFAAIAMAKRQR